MSVEEALEQVEPALKGQPAPAGQAPEPGQDRRAGGRRAEDRRAEDRRAEDRRRGDRRKSDRRGGEEVRQQLRDYLDGVREKLGAPALPRGTPPAPTGPHDLLDYLENLSEYLPERDRRVFRASSQRLAIESLKARLAGTKGLRESVSRKYRPAAAAPAPLSRPRIVDTFSYLKDLTGWLPDRTVGAAMRERLDSLIARLGRTG